MAEGHGFAEQHQRPAGGSGRTLVGPPRASRRPGWRNGAWNMNSSASSPHPWLSRYAKLVVAVTFGLIFLGGMVTSKDAGLSVPDWPTSYGYSMFTFPFSRWIGGVFFEHLHRLVASGV